MKRIVTTMGFFILSAAASASPINFDCKFSREASPDGIKDSKFNLSFILDDATKKAYITGDNGSAEVVYIPNVEGMTFIEITPVGNVMVTAISYKDNSAVHSRNGIIFDKLIPTQFYGKCLKR